MTIAALLLAMAAPPTAPAELMLGCRLATPAGDDIAFAARLGSPVAVLEPASGTAWPTQRVIGPGAWREKKGVEARYFFAGQANNVELRVEGERATLFVDKRLRPKSPRAYGFCLPVGDSSAVRPDALVRPSAGADVPAFDPARWPETCGLVTRSGRRARIDYTLQEGGRRSEISSGDAGLLASAKVAVTRVQGSGANPTLFGSRDGPAGAETLVVDAKSAEAVQLIRFDRIGATAASGEPAAAICGYTGIVKRPVMQ